MRHLLKSDKRGISIMIGYVILIGMAVGLTIMVYQWLIHYVPSGDSYTAKCSEEISISIANLRCDSESMNLRFKIKNTGTFPVDHFSVKVSDKPGSNIGSYEIMSEGEGPKIPVNGEYDFNYDYSGHVQGSLDPYFESRLTFLEVTPFQRDEDGTLRVCYSEKTDLDCFGASENCFNGKDDDKDGAVDCEDSDCGYSFYCSRSNSDIFLHLPFEGSNIASLENYGSSGDAATNIGGVSHQPNGGYDGRGAYYFDGNDDCMGIVSDSEADKLGADFTVSMLIKPDIPMGADLSPRFMSRDCAQYWCFGMKSDTSGLPFNFTIQSDNDHETSEMEGFWKVGASSDWRHVVVSFDHDAAGVRGFADIYINGSLFQSWEYDSSANSGVSTGIVLGCNSPSATGENNYNGSIDEVMIINRSLTYSEVEDLYESYLNNGL